MMSNCVDATLVLANNCPAPRARSARQMDLAGELLFLAAVLVLIFVAGQRAQVAAAAAPATDAERRAPLAAVKLAALPADPEVARYLETEFCAGGLCEPGAWETWIDAGADTSWTVGEVAMVRQALDTTVAALDEAGYDGRRLLAGYRFRREPGECVRGKTGRVGVTVHESREVVLGEAAFKRLWGFYLYHEIGHVVDRRTDYELRERFRALTHRQQGAEGERTADGYWLNGHARGQYKEATADAFAVYVIMNYTDNPKPVFWHTPRDVDYEAIETVMGLALAETAGPPRGR